MDAEQKPQWMIDHELADAKAFKELNDKLDAHMALLQPYLQGAAGLGLLWKVLVAIGGAVVIWVQIKQGLWGN